MKIKLIAAACLTLSFCCAAAANICSNFSKGRVYVGPSLFIQQTSANDSRFRGLHPRFSLGYADLSNKYYLAAELFVVPTTMSLSDTRNPGGTSSKTSFSIGASLIPGTRLYHDLFGFARLGVISSKFSSPNVSKLGAQMGLGLQSGLTMNWVLRGEYIYTTYSNVSQVGTANVNELGVGLIYLFDN